MNNEDIQKLYPRGGETQSIMTMTVAQSHSGDKVLLIDGQVAAVYCNTVEPLLMFKVKDAVATAFIGEK